MTFEEAVAACFASDAAASIFALGVTFTIAVLFTTVFRDLFDLIFSILRNKFVK